MGNVVRFPPHATTAGKSRAAKATSKSAVTPASCAFSVANTAAHHSSGIRLRCAHLRAPYVGAPISAASAAGDSHKPTMSRNDVISDMETSLGHYVLKSKAEMSHDLCGELLDNARMAERLSRTQDDRDFIKRVRIARRARYPKQTEFAELMEIPQDTYKQYEGRTPLPRRYYKKFCLATGVEMDWLLTGKGEGPEWLNVPDEPKRRRRRSRKAAAA